MNIGDRTHQSKQPRKQRVPHQERVSEQLCRLVLQLAQVRKKQIYSLSSACEQSTLQKASVFATMEATMEAVRGYGGYGGKGYGKVLSKEIQDLCYCFDLL